MDIGAEFDFIMVASWLLFSTVIAILSYSGDVTAAGTCVFQQGTTSVVAYCENGCCDTDCCSFASSASVDTTLILIILGVTLAVVVVVFVIVAIVCCLKDRKREKKKDTVSMELTHRPDGRVSSADAERPKLHRENAIFMVNGYSKSRPQKPSERETSFVNNGVNSPHTRRHSGSLRTAKVRPSDAFLPQMDEIEEVENESVS